MLSKPMMQQFRETTDALNNDIYLQHICNLHGPYEIVEPRLVYNDRGPQEINSIQYKCLACNTLWPCATFSVLQDKAQAMQPPTMRMGNGGD